MPNIDLESLNAEIERREKLEAINSEIAKRESQQTSFGEDIVGGLETAATVVSGAVAEPLSGIAGLAQSINPFADEGAGVDAIKTAQQTLTYQPRTEAGKRQLSSVAETLQPVGEAFQSAEQYLGNATLEATGSPELAAIAHSIPTAALEALGVKGLRSTGKGSMPLDDIAKQKSFVAQGYEPTELNRRMDFDAAKKEQLNKALASGDKEQLAAMMDADPEFFKALDALDAKQKGLPSAASRNRQYQETEQALKKMPGSELSKIEFDQVSEIQSIADNMITEFGGLTDKSELSMSLFNDSQKVIDNLSSTTEAAYKNIADNIPKSTMSNMDNIGAQMTQELADLGGDISQLSPLEKRLLDMSENGATYHAIDKIRKEVGNTIGKKSDKYKSEDVGALKRIYANLTKDQEVVANDLGMSDAWGGAKELVQQRKLLEDNSVAMFGKNLSDAFMPKMGLAMKKLSTGDYKKFDELLSSVPASKRQQVIVSALNDVFTMGSRKEKQLSVAGYADWFNGLNKNPKLKKEIYSNIPKELQVKLDALGKVTNGIRNAQSAAPIGGQVMANTGVFDKVTNGIAKRFLAKMPGILGDVVEAGLEKGKSKGFDNAMAVLGDPDFTANLKALAAGQARKAEILEKKLLKKKKTQDFINSLPTKEAKAVSVLGIASWLSRQEEESKP